MHVCWYWTPLSHGCTAQPSLLPATCSEHQRQEEQTRILVAKGRKREAKPRIPASFLQTAPSVLGERSEDDGGEPKERSSSQHLEPTICFLRFAWKNPGFSCQVPQNEYQCHLHILSYTKYTHRVECHFRCGIQNILRRSCVASPELFLSVLLDFLCCFPLRGCSREWEQELLDWLMSFLAAAAGYSNCVLDFISLRSLARLIDPSGIYWGIPL